MLKKTKKTFFVLASRTFRKHVLINKILCLSNKFFINYNFLFLLIKNLSVKLYVNVLFFSVNFGLTCNFFSLKFFINQLINKKKYNLNNISDYLYGLFLEINKIPVVLLSFYNLLFLNDNLQYNKFKLNNICFYLRSNPIYNFIIERKIFILRSFCDFSFFIKLSFVKLLTLKKNIFNVKKKKFYVSYNIRKYKKRFKFNIKKIKFNFSKLINNFFFWILVTFLSEYLYYTKVFFVC